jgi:hypothetical protein
MDRLLLFHYELTRDLMLLEQARSASMPTSNNGSNGTHRSRYGFEAIPTTVTVLAAPPNNRMISSSPLLSWKQSW